MRGDEGRVRRETREIRVMSVGEEEREDKHVESGLKVKREDSCI